MEMNKGEPPAVGETIEQSVNLPADNQGKLLTTSSQLSKPLQCPAKETKEESHCKEVQFADTVKNEAPEALLFDYLKNPSKTIDHYINWKNSFEGFADVVSNEKPPSNFARKIVKNLLFVLYFFIVYACQIAFLTKEKVHHTYYVVFIVIAFIGSFFSIMTFTRNLIGYTCQKSSQEGEEILTCIQSKIATCNCFCLQAPFMHKVINGLMNYSSVEEFLLLPSLICSLYGFINKESWTFDNAIAGCNFILLLCTIAMNVWYDMVILMYLLKIITTSYDKYYYLKGELINWKKPCNYSLYVIIPFAVMKTIISYLMLFITTVRIYVDNFALERNTSEPEPTTGSYRTSNFTSYMIFCNVVLPFATEIAFIIVNKYSFCEVYSLINQLGKKEIHTQFISGWVKLFGCVRDPAAYIPAVTVMLLFIAFAVGTFLPDYDHSEFDIPVSTVTATKILGTLFIIFFILSNFQVVILFLIVVVIIIVSIPVGVCLFAKKVHNWSKGCDSSESSPQN